MIPVLMNLLQNIYGNIGHLRKVYGNIGHSYTVYWADTSYVYSCWKCIIARISEWMTGRQGMGSDEFE